MFYDLLNLVQDYLDGRLTVRHVEVWLTSRLQPIIRAGDPATVQLADSIDADLIEFGEGLIDEDTLRELWRGYLDRVRVRVSFSSGFAHVYQGGATSSVNRHFRIESVTLAGPYEVPKADRSESGAKIPSPNHYVDKNLVVTEVVAEDAA
jgi:hypothetical protein